MKRLAALLTLAVTLVLGGSAGAEPASEHSKPPPKHLHFHHPRPKGTACSGPDVSGVIQAYAKAFSGGTLTLPANRCFVVNAGITIRDATNLTINGNGSTLVQTVAPAVQHPMLQLWHDTNLKIVNLTLDGGNGPNNSAGGEGTEGDYGVQLEGDTNVSFTSSTVKNTLGDWVYLSPPYDVDNETDALNTGITFSGDTFLNAGYHGFTVESVGCPTAAACNGLTITGSTMVGMNVDAMDFEYDTYSTPFQNAQGASCTPTTKNTTTCLPFWAAESYVTVSNNTWKDWGNDWFASIQGQGPGVQEQHLTLTGNTLIARSAIFEVEGTNRATTPEQYTNDFWTITNNAFAPGYYVAPYRGGDSAAGQLYSISHLTLTGNTFPGCAGDFEQPEPASLCGAPNEYLFDLDVITWGTMANNNFSGMLGVVQPQPYPTYLTAFTQCGNRYGAMGSLLDAKCAVP